MLLGTALLHVVLRRRKRHSPRSQQQLQNQAKAAACPASPRQRLPNSLLLLLASPGIPPPAMVQAALLGMQGTLVEGRMGMRRERTGRGDSY
jgi:hypothetical protein